MDGAYYETKNEIKLSRVRTTIHIENLHIL